MTIRLTSAPAAGGRAGVGRQQREHEEQHAEADTGEDDDLDSAAPLRGLHARPVRDLAAPFALGSQGDHDRLSGPGDQGAHRPEPGDPKQLLLEIGLVAHWTGGADQTCCAHRVLLAVERLVRPPSRPRIPRHQ
ncbi:MAG TPA: hypothetical protein VFR23_24130 [Jiangellaceae bacterium]|nr:hypothetical protein [Jiangellaceae bacterium]